jgi:ferric-dicitrate binding protein FerR (iron transport regulator)
MHQPARPDPQLIAHLCRLATIARLEIMSDGRLESRGHVEITGATAWQHGMVVLDDMPLTAALEVLNRYADTQIVVRGAELQSRRISGTFRAGDVATEALALRRYFRLHERTHTALQIVLEAD